jgi:imidazolonepropionase-like amidohydrolase
MTLRSPLTHALFFAVPFLLLVAAAAVPDAGRAQSAPYDLLLRGGQVIDGTGRPAVNAGVAIRGDTIAAVGDLSGATADQVIDAAGRYVLPGFADMHVHFGSGGLRSTSTDRVLRQYLFYGVTTVFNVGGSSGRTSSMQALRPEVASGEVTAPRIYAAGNMLTVPGSHPVATIMRLPPGADSATYDWSEKGIALVETPSDARGAVRANAEAGMDAIKIFVESGPPPFGDDHPQMPPEMISAVVEEASSQGLPVVAHVSTLDELEDAVEGGVHAIMHAVERPPLPGPEHWADMRARDIFYVPTLSLYSTMMTDRWTRPGARQDSFLRSGVAAPTLSSLDKWHSPTASMPNAKRDRLWENLLASVDATHEAGVPLAPGTDNGMPFVFPGYSVHEELELLVEAGLTPMEALVSATRRAAEMMGAEEHLRNRRVRHTSRSPDFGR